MLLSHPMSYFIYLHLKGLPNQQKPENVFTLYNQNLLETKKNHLFYSLGRVGEVGLPI